MSLVFRNVEKDGVGPGKRGNSEREDGTGRKTSSQGNEKAEVGFVPGIGDCGG